MRISRNFTIKTANSTWGSSHKLTTSIHQYIPRQIDWNKQFHCKKNQIKHHQLQNPRIIAKDCQQIAVNISTNYNYINFIKFNSHTQTTHRSREIKLCNTCESTKFNQNTRKSQQENMINRKTSMKTQVYEYTNKHKNQGVKRCKLYTRQKIEEKYWMSIILWSIARRF